MSKEEKIINYYVLCNRLKHLIRTGWKNWHVKSDRLESVAEHIYGTQMLAIAINSEYEYDIDILKVIFMLAIHELGETIIGDLTPFQISKDEKRKIEHDAIHEILSDLIDGDSIEKILIEFDEHKTKESLFAFWCDKLECDLQCKLYDEDSLVDLNKQSDNNSFYDEEVQALLKDNDSWSTMWLKFSQNKYGYDDNFKAISNYALSKKIKRQ